MCEGMCICGVELSTRFGCSKLSSIGTRALSCCIIIILCYKLLLCESRETNLKVRQAKPETAEMQKDHTKLADFRGALTKSAD